MIGLGLVAGLLCVVLLLGYGIAAVPMNLFKYATLKKKLRYYQYRVAEYDMQIAEKSAKL
jgi:hypothetical protein